jgi:hypothetical protein
MYLKYGLYYFNYLPCQLFVVLRRRFSGVPFLDALGRRCPLVQQYAQCLWRCHCRNSSWTGSVYLVALLASLPKDVPLLEPRVPKSSASA